MTITHEQSASATAAPSALWYTRCPVPTVSGIAQNKQWLQRAFDEIGIRLDSVIASTDRSVRESHFRHSLEGSFREGGNVPPIWTRSRGQDTVVVAVTWVDEVQLVLVHPDSEVAEVAGLRGRRVGLVRKEESDLVDVGRAESLRGLLTALEVNGVGRDEVEWIDLAAPEWDLREQHQQPAGPTRPLLVEAVLSGSVDAVFLKGAGVAAALDAGLRPIFDNNSLADQLLRVSAGSPRPVTVDRATLEAAPDLVDRYLAVLLRTAEWAREHPEEVVRIVAAETGTEPEAVRRAFGPDLHLTFEPQLSDIYVEGLRQQKDFLLAEGFIEADFDVDSWVDRSVLPRARGVAGQIQHGYAD